VGRSRRHKGRSYRGFVAGRLILCATPIGNLGDASPRLAEALDSADLILAEDTRRSAVLLRSLGIKKPLRSYFAGNESKRATALVDLLEQGKIVALVTDAGTPGISDPGVSAVQAARDARALVSAIPGPSAVTVALSVSGFPSERFVFEGFLPKKGTERDARLTALASETRTTVLFVAPHHLIDDLTALASIAPDRPLCIARELTKVFEEIQWSTPGLAVQEWSEREIQGEFTLVLAGGDPAEPDLEENVGAVLAEIDRGIQMSEAVRTVASRSGVPRRRLYQEVLARTRRTSP
jgi:16S rRNA (cytidine1402-2'-O)-methyltransferase